MLESFANSHIPGVRGKARIHEAQTCFCKVLCKHTLHVVLAATDLFVKAMLVDFTIMHMLDSQCVVNVNMQGVTMVFQADTAL